MRIEDALTSLLIGIGTVVMLLSILGTRRVLVLVSKRRVAPYWRALMNFMVFFALGYVLAGILVLVGLQTIVLILTGIVFLGGAVFVYLVVRLGYVTIGDLETTANLLEQQVKDRTVELRNQAEALSKANSELETRGVTLEQAVEARTAEVTEKNHQLARVNEIVAPGPVCAPFAPLGLSESLRPW